MPSFFSLGRLEIAGDILVPLLFAVGVLAVLYYASRRLKLWRRNPHSTILLPPSQLSEISRPARWTLVALRLLAIAGLVLWILKPQWESLVGASRVVVLIDTSASMATSDVVNVNDVGDAETHTRLAAAEIVNASLVEQLARKHDITLVRFDRETQAVNRNEKLVASGDQTRLGDAILTTLADQRGAPMAAIVVLTDGGQNAGASLETAAAAARAARVPIHTVGFGATTAQPSLRVVRFNVPERVAPDDPFSVTAAVEYRGESGATQRVVAEFWLTPNENSVATKIAEQELSFTDAVTFTHEVKLPNGATGNANLELRLVEPDLSPHRDDVRTIARRFEVIDRTQRLLLMPGTPTRDYQFLVDQLARDKHCEADLVAPWGDANVSQSVRRVLESFPQTATEMAEYDGIIAFDPDWSRLTVEQVSVIDEWLAQRGGGLVVTAGPLYTKQLLEGTLRSASLEKVRAFYPVELLAHTSASETGYRSGDRARPLVFTRDGEAADFLRLDDDVTRSRSLWNEVEFYGAFFTRAVKPTSTLDITSNTAAGDAAASLTGVIVAEQWYGSGRVVFLGSGELWRLRRIDPKLFERLTTQIIRHATQGKSLRVSDRVSLAMDRANYSLGSVAVIHATATDAQRRPVVAASLAITVTAPDARVVVLDLAPHATNAGAFQGFFPLTQEGEWRLRLAVPDSTDSIEQKISVTMSDLERENPVRQIAALETLSRDTDASSLDGDRLISDAEQVVTFSDSIRVRSHRAVVDGRATERFLTGLLAVILAALLLEWLLRRCWKLP
ncbi:MAG: hypothetical protein ACRC46_01825 [Thermoguttaceae bacterium]